MQLRELYQADDAPEPEPLIAPLALIGKLAGTTVCHVVARPKENVLEIIHLYVARDMRRKRVGRGLLRRLEELAARMHYSRLVAGVDSPCDRFLKHAGFVSSGAGLEKPVDVAADE